MWRRLLLGCVLSGITLYTPAYAADPIKIGAIFPLSGGAGKQGQQVTQAIQAMASLINAGGGVLGRQIEVRRARRRKHPRRRRRQGE